MPLLWLLAHFTHIHWLTVTNNLSASTLHCQPYLWLNTLVLFCSHLSRRMATTSTNATSVAFAFTSLLWEAQIWISLPCPALLFTSWYQRTQGRCHLSPLCQPITMLHLLSILSWLQASTPTTTDNYGGLLASWPSLEFFGLLNTQLLPHALPFQLALNFYLCHPVQLPSLLCGGFY